MNSVKKMMAGAGLALLVMAGCASTDTGAGMNVAQFLAVPPMEDSVVTVRDRIVTTIDDRSFVIGSGSNAILVTNPGDMAIVGTRGGIGDTVVVTGRAQMMREGDPALLNVDPTTRALITNRPGIIATNVQVVER